MAESIKISELDELVSGSVIGTTKVPVVDGGATKYTQASSIKAYVNSDVATDAELSAQISAVNSTIDGLTTADISENASYLYYTDTRVTNRLNALNVLSGSSTSLTVTDGDTTATTVDSITFDGAVVTNNGSGDVTVTVPSALRVGNGEGIPISNVDFIVFDGATITDDSNGDITVTIAGGSSTDISALNTFTGSIRNEINGIEAFTASFSSSVESRIVTLEGAGGSTTDGTISGSQQITDFGFLSSSVEQRLNLLSGGAGLLIESASVGDRLDITITNTAGAGGGDGVGWSSTYHILSQSRITGESNVILSDVYVDSNKDITFLLFSSSLNSRIAGVSGGGSTDYISNVTFANNTITFTGEGLAFEGSVPLSNGLISSSAQILDLGYPAIADINEIYIQSRLPNGLLSGSTQISNLGFLNSSVGNIVSSSSQIILSNTVSGGFDTSNVAENENFQYYTDEKVQAILNAIDLVSGSATISGSVSSSSQIDYQLVYNKVEFYTGSNNLTITSGSPAGATAYGSPWVKFEILSPTYTEFYDIANKINSSVISGSSQLTALGFIDNSGLAPLNYWTGSEGGFASISQSINLRINSVSASIGGASALPNGVVSASAQIDYDFIQNRPTFANGDGILISQSLENAITITSNASAPTWDSISLKPYNIVTSSIQVQEYNLFAETSSANTFYDNQTILGELETNTLSVIGASTFQNIGVGGTSTFTGPVYNVVGELITTPPTASLDFSTGNFFQIQLDNTTATHISASNTTAGQVVTVLLQCGTNSTASFSSNILQPSDSFYTASQVGEVDIITFTTFGSNVYLTSVKNNFV